MKMKKIYFALFLNHFFSYWFIKYGFQKYLNPDFNKMSNILLVFFALISLAHLEKFVAYIFIAILNN